MELTRTVLLDDRVNVLGLDRVDDVICSSRHLVSILDDGDTADA